MAASSRSANWTTWSRISRRCAGCDEDAAGARPAAGRSGAHRRAGDLPATARSGTRAGELAHVLGQLREPPPQPADANHGGERPQFGAGVDLPVPHVAESGNVAAGSG